MIALSPYRVSEAETRYNLIDPQLKKAGWNLFDRTQVGLEIPVAGYDATPFEGITDYCLYRTNGDVLAVVEAKRTSRDARIGKQQVLEYVEAIEKKQPFRPFAFMANGDEVARRAVLQGASLRESRSPFLHLPSKSKSQPS